MKKVILGLMLLACSFSLIAQDSEEEEMEWEPYEVLTIAGEITEGEETLDGVMVELYEGNKVVDSFETKKNGKFKFRLYSEQIYTIQLTKSGYYVKRISVSTRMPAEIEDAYKFDFDINLDSKAEKNFDEYLVEYPSALISFNAKQDEFGFDRNYTRSYFKEIEVSQ